MLGKRRDSATGQLTKIPWVAHRSPVIINPTKSLRPDDNCLLTQLYTYLRI